MIDMIKMQQILMMQSGMPDTELHPITVPARC